MEHYLSEEFEGAVHQRAQNLTTAVGDASSEAGYEDRDFVNSDDEAGMGSRSADRGSMELAIEVVTTERTYSQVKRRNLRLQGLVCEACEVVDRAPQCS